MDNSNGQDVAELADRYGRLVFATSYRILGNTHDAEDVLQQVFLKLLGVGGSKVNPGAIQDWGAYLRTIASRAALDLLRAKRQRHWQEMSLKVDVAREQGAAETAASEEKTDRLRQAMAALPQRDALIFSLRYFEELSYEDIATQTGLSIDLIGVMLHRSRKVLRELLDQFQARQQTEKS